MKWLLCTEDFPPEFIGGISSWSNDLADALHSSGEEVQVFARQTANGRTFDAQKSYSIKRVWGRKWSHHKAKWMYLALLGTTADIALFSCWELAVLSAPYLRRKGVLIAIALHGSDITRTNINTTALKALDPFVHLWLPVSGFLQQTVQEYLPASDTLILPMPLDIPEIPVQRVASAPLICIARYTPYKGIERTIQIAEQLNKELWLIGDQRYQQSTDRIKGFGIKSRLECLSLLAQSSAAILLSNSDPAGYHQEGLGLVLLEAASLGIPSIGSFCGGIPEALGPGFLWTEDTDLTALTNWLQQDDIGLLAWTWVREQHGKQRCIDVLKEALS